MILMSINAATWERLADLLKPVLDEFVACDAPEIDLF